MNRHGRTPGGRATRRIMEKVGMVVLMTGAVGVVAGGAFSDKILLHLGVGALFVSALVFALAASFDPNAPVEHIPDDHFGM